MTIRNVKDNLNLLDISSISQLDSNDIDYWWEEKYLSIKYDDSIPDDKKNNLLVSINKARDELNVIEIKIIKQILNKNQKEYPSDNNEYYPENNRNNFVSYLKDYYSDTFWNRLKKIEWWQFPIVMILYRLIKYYSSN
tara:strand:- start:31 stop:444 length:414 start_codon:yes stop_codon:yes gene_type:complete